MAMRKTSPGWSCPDFPRACSTAFHSESDWAVAVSGMKLSTAATTTAITLGKLMTGSFVEVFSPGRRLPLVLSCHVAPADVLHERIDVLGRRGAVVHVIRVLVHVEGENRRTACEAGRVVRGPLIDKLAIARRIGEQHPAGSPTHCFAHGDELGAPSLDTAEVTGHSFAQRSIRLSTLTEAIEIELVQDHGVRRDQLFALESVDHEHWCHGHVESRELSHDRVEAFHRTAIVVLVVAHDELL